jgi:rubrerythrin
MDVALASEVKAYEYFDAALAHVRDPAVRSLFEELRTEEAEHQELVKAVIAKIPPDDAIGQAYDADEPVGQ